MAENSSSVRCTNCALLSLQPAAPRQTRTARAEELLHGNHPPLDIELPVFRADLASARAALQDIDAKIAQAEELLENLFSARQQAQLNLDNAESLLHPIRSIPSELLLEIFSHCVPTVMSPLDTDSLHSGRAPWLMTLVCHRWRELAMNSPRLWTQLLIDFGYAAGSGVDLMSAYRASLFIERSRGLPMAIYLASTELVADHWLTVIGNGISHCRFLHVDIPRSSLQCLFERVFPHLRTLVVFTDHWDHPDDNLGVYQPLRAPALRELDVLSREFWGNLEAAALPWSQLTSVGNFPAFDVEAWRHLRTMTNLENLRVHVEDSEIDTQIPDSIIMLPKLRRLTMIERHSATGRTKQFLAALQIPALVDLILKFPIGAITLFPTLSSTSPLRNLTRLDISCTMDAHEENTKHLLDFLTLTPGVEQLRIHDRTMMAEFVDGLNISNESPVRLPSLVFLDIGDCRCDGATFDDIGPIVDMLHSRLPRGDTTEDAVHQQSLVVATGVVAVSARADCTHLKTVHLPRSVYVGMRDHWPHTFLEISRKVRLVCGVA